MPPLMHMMQGRGFLAAHSDINVAKEKIGA
jgi:hypothetical protein